MHNVPNDPIFDPFLPQHNNLRIWCNNANTLSTYNDFTELHELCDVLKQHNVNIICMQEINIDLLNITLHNKITDVFKQHFNVARLVFSTTPIQSPTSWKPGGTMLAVVGSLAHSVTEHHADHLGRWSKVVINGNNDKRLIVYNVYNVVSTSIDNVGHHTIFHQQWCLLRLAGKKNPQPKATMH